LYGQINDYSIQKATKESTSKSCCFISQTLFGNLSFGVKEEGVNLSGIEYGIKQKINAPYSKIEFKISSSKKFLQNILLDFLSYCITYTSDFTCILRI
jgi:hypothetical protein